MDHPRFGKAEPCDCILDEAEDTRRSRLERISNLGSLTRFTFDTLIRSGRDAETGFFPRAYDAAQAYAAKPEGWLVITGPSGSGKTHLAAAIANDRISRGAPALFMVVPDLLDHLRASYDAGEGELGFESLFDQVRNAPLLILDDIDAAASTDWVKEKLFQVVNHRFNASLPTIYTTTRRPQQLEDRLATRLLDERLCRVLVLEGAGPAAYEQVGGMTRDRLAAMTFANFNPRGAGTGQQEIASLDAAYRVAMGFADSPQGWLTLQGVNGCGKTHLAAAVANRVLRDGGSVFFAVVPDLLDHLRSTFAPGSETTYDATFERVRNAGLLVLDDLGSQQTSPWAQEKLFQVVNYRTVAGLPTVVTTDRALNELQAVHPRIVARLADPGGGIVISILAPHYRLGRVPDQPRRR